MKLTIPQPILIFAVVIMVLASSCSGYQRLLRSTDNELKLVTAKEFYEDEEYTKALGLLTQLIPVFRGTVHAEEVNYYFAMAHYKIGDYISASEHFTNFTIGFPRSRHTEEFLFMSAYTKYLMAPRSSLDQKNTREAINAFQLFVNRYPQSLRVDEANTLIDNLRLRLEEKVYNQAMLFLNLSDYTAAITTFNNLIRDFPDTRFREEALFRIVQANFDFATLSIVQRQKERFSAAITAHNRLIRHFPESRFKAQSERLQNQSQEIIERLAGAGTLSENQ